MIGPFTSHDLIGLQFHAISRDSGVYFGMKCLKSNTSYEHTSFTYIFWRNSNEISGQNRTFQCSVPQLGLQAVYITWPSIACRVSNVSCFGNCFVSKQCVTSVFCTVVLGIFWRHDFHWETIFINNVSVYVRRKQLSLKRWTLWDWTHIHPLREEWSRHSQMAVKCMKIYHILDLWIL